jgi:hypothetical protein
LFALDRLINIAHRKRRPLLFGLLLFRRLTSGEPPYDETLFRARPQLILPDPLLAKTQSVAKVFCARVTSPYCATSH